MIHRFIENIPRELRPIWPFQVTQASPLNLQSIWLAGGAQTSVRLSQTLDVIDGVTFLGDPLLSPDETEVAYSLVQDPSGATPVRARVMVAQADDLSSPTVVVTDPDTPASSNSSIYPYWSPDGTKIIFVSHPSPFTGNTHVKRVNRDGTGLTTLRTITSGYTRHCTYSFSGDYICFAKIDSSIFNLPAEIWVMEDDGSNPTLVHTTTSFVAVGEKDFPAWQRNADVLAWYDPGVGFRKCNADGSSKVTILADTMNSYWGTCVFSWLSDDSALVSVNSSGDLVLIDGAGGGVSSLGITGVEQHDVWVAKTSQETRIYYSKIVGGSARVLHSVTESGADERVEHDPAASSPAAVHHGIYGRNAN